MIRYFTSKNQKKGEKGEEVAVTYLVKQGFRIYERNVTTRYGEIDIVAKKAGVYYFYEVKSGWKGGIYTPAENLTPSKRRKVLLSVEYYCMVHQVREYQVFALIVLFVPHAPTSYEVAVYSFS